MGRTSSSNDARATAIGAASSAAKKPTHAFILLSRQHAERHMWPRKPDKEQIMLTSLHRAVKKLPRAAFKLRAGSRQTELSGVKALAHRQTKIRQRRGGTSSLGCAG